MSDLTITGASVWTGVGPAGERPRPATVLVRDGMVAGLDFAPGSGKSDLHLPGRVVVPGFQDAHVHPPFGGRFRRALWMHDLSGVDAYVSAVAGYAAEHPDREWIFGSGWEMEWFHPGRPTRDLLDAVVPDRPVFLFNASLHEAWLNTRALELGGLSAATPDPSDGRYVRFTADDLPRGPDGSGGRLAAGGMPVGPGATGAGFAPGDLTGHLIEGAAHRFERTVVPAPSVEEWADAILVAQDHLLSLGITGWQDAWVTPPILQAYVALADRGDLLARVVGALWWERDRGLEQIPGFVSFRNDTVRERFNARTVKIMVDGVMENFSAGLLAPYHDGCGGLTHHHGNTYVPDDVLAEALVELDRLDFQVHLHTLGDRAVRSGLDALAAARKANGDRGNRHTMAHLQLIDPDDVPRFAELGALPNCQTYWAQSEPAMDVMTVPFLGEDRSRLQYPFASLARAGARLVMGSDWPVSTADPLQQIEVAVRRTDPSRRDLPPFLASECLTVDESLRAFSSGAAFANHDDDAGRLVPGARADLAVLDGDPFEGYPGDVGVETTIIGGTIVFQR